MTRVWEERDPASKIVITDVRDGWRKTTGCTASITLHGFNYNVEEWDAEGLHYETLAICRQLAFARAVFKEAIAEKPGGWFMIRSRTRVVKRYPEGDW